MRDIPIFTFINKMDREARDPFELCEEMEQELGIDTYAVNWPIGCGKEFQGVYDRNRAARSSASPPASQRQEGQRHRGGAGRPRLWTSCSGQSRRRPAAATRWSCWTAPACDFDLDRVRHGKLSPVFFGSALTNFGVEPFLEEFLRMTTPPLPAAVSDREHRRLRRQTFSAFVFKIQANMNKAHRDRIAFMRIVLRQV